MRELRRVSLREWGKVEIVERTIDSLIQNLILIRNYSRFN